MPDKRIALVTGANQGVSLQVARNSWHTASRCWSDRATSGAAREIRPGAIALQLDVTDRV